MMALADLQVAEAHLKRLPSSDFTSGILRAQVLVALAAGLTEAQTGRTYKCKAAAALAPQLIDLLSDRCEGCDPVRTSLQLCHLTADLCLLVHSGWSHAT